MAGIRFSITPAGTGNIICDGLNAPINRLLYVPSGTECIAESNEGFEFSSWGEINNNSTRTINTSSPSGPFWTTFTKFLGIESDDPSATFTVNQFGNFTAYFRALPPPLPADYWATLFSIIVTALVGSLLIPGVIGWANPKRQFYRLNSFHKQMALAYEDNRLDEKDLRTLNSLHKNISDSYAAGKINSDQYTTLKNEISIAYEEIYKKKIKSLISNSDELQEIKSKIKDAYSKGKLTELHYNLLNEEISQREKTSK
jgi:uncharacterized membrane protein